MPLTGTLKSWNDDRGFGFIAPTNSVRELFVHISAFPRDGSRPVVGESLTFEIGRGQHGKLQAVRVCREAALRQPSTYRRTRAVARRGRSPLITLIGFAFLIVLGIYGYNSYRRQETQDTPQSDYRCDGRTHCSQMTSCSEAEFFLKNCPGVQMDGDNDGVPCEQQWCSDSRPK